MMSYIPPFYRRRLLVANYKNGYTQEVHMAERGILEVGELSPGDMKMVEEGDNQVLLTNVDGNIYAGDNVCTHAFAPLFEGALDGDQVECPLHGSVFNVTTRQVMGPPADENLRVFQVRIDGQDILVGPPT